jgi:hypothetical protein
MSRKALLFCELAPGIIENVHSLSAPSTDSSSDPLMKRLDRYKFISHRELDRLMKRADLTSKQRAVFMYTVELGLGPVALGQKLGIAECTVRDHLKTSLPKVDKCLKATEDRLEFGLLTVMVEQFGWEGVLGALKAKTLEKYGL